MYVDNNLVYREWKFQRIGDRARLMYIEREVLYKGSSDSISIKECK